MIPISKTACHAVTLTMALCITSCGWVSSKPEPVSAERVADARKYIQAQAIHNPASDMAVMFRVFATAGDSYIKNIDITPRKLKIVTETNIASAGNVFVLPLKYLNPADICDAFTCLVSMNPHGDLYGGGNYTDYELDIPRNDIKSASQKADNLTYALSTLEQAAFQERSTDPQFRHVVSDYRALSPKPALPEEAGRYKMQAEDAVRDRKFDDAADDYAQALEIAPWWPEGHLNLATALAELNDYRGAIDEMKCYLMLVPDDSDAQASQDKIKDWEKKIPEQK